MTATTRTPMVAGPSPHRPPPRRRPAARRVKSVVLHTLSIATAAIILVPVFYGVLGGFKDNGQLANNPLGLPSPWVPGNYGELLISGDYWRQVANSTLIALGTVLLVVGAGAGAAFVFARFAFRGREAFFTLFAAGLMFPFAVAILPLFILLRTFDLLDNPLGVILPQAAFQLPLTIIILRSFFRTIPGEVEESATLDGCGPWGFFWRILLPMARPALATVSVLAIVMSWNNFFLPLVIFNDQTWWTLPVGVQQFQGQYSIDTARVLAFVSLSMIPALIFFSIFERRIISGLTGAVKG